LVCPQSAHKYIDGEKKIAVKLPTVWTHGRAEVIRVREEKGRRKKIRGEKGTRRKIKAREKVEKSRNTVFFPMFRGSGGSKSGLAKAAGAEPSGRMRGQKLHAVAARNFEVKMLKSTPFLEHVWKFRCRKSARGCGAKHMWKSKRTKHTVLGS